jgi:hypothetical protein
MFNPHNWYWLNDNGAVYSSSRQAIVAKTDSDYLAWTDAGGIATRWPEDELSNQTYEALFAVVSVYGLVVAESIIKAAKQKRVAELSEICAAKIIGGFSSAALGDSHTYPSDIKAQINLMGSVTDSLMPGLPTDWQTPFWVSDADGAWSYRMHNIAQIQQAGRDGKAHVVTCQAILEALTAEVSVAETAEAAASITWPT